MLSCVVTTIVAFIGNVNGSEAVTLATSLPTVGLSIMVLLALSSHRAREYATRARTLPSTLPGGRTSRPLSPPENHWVRRWPSVGFPATSS